MRTVKSAPESRDDPRSPEPEDADGQTGDDGYFVLPLEVLERWRAATDLRS